MLILLSQLVNRPIIAFDEAEPLGVIRDPIIDPDKGKVVGYFVGHGFMHMKQGVVAIEDIVGYDEARVVIQKPSAIREPADEPKIKKILDRKIPVMGARVITESGRHLGRANDLLLDTELDMIVRYYVHGLMSDRIVAAEHIIAIEKRGIIVDDTAPTAGAVAAEVANN